jgi:hypothetical protein
VLGLGVAIAFVASVAYAAVWEVSLAATNYAFIHGYFDAQLREVAHSGQSAAAIAKQVGELNAQQAQYWNPLFRFPMTFMELFPVGLTVAILSAVGLWIAKLVSARRVTAAA